MSILDRILGFFEYVLVALYVRGGIVVIFGDAAGGVPPGIVPYLLSSAAIYLYGGLFLFLGLALLYSKLKKNPNRLHRWVQGCMYVTCVYVLVLSVAINGLILSQLLTVSCGIFSAAMWLRYKLQMDYMSRRELISQIKAVGPDERN